MLYPSEPAPGQRYFERKSPVMTQANLFDLSDLPAEVMTHLRKVYLLLTATLIMASGGVLVDLRYHAGHPLWSFGVLALMLLLMWMPGAPANVWARAGILQVLAFMQGLALGPLIQSVAASDPWTPLIALLLTAAVFVSFSVTALLAKRRSYLYLGAPLFSILLVVFFSSLLNIFFHSEFLFNIWLYLGLVMTVGFILFDTQVIVERAAHGDQDIVWHALDLFFDFCALFIRILIILNRRNQKQSSNSIV